jgi:putative two-component system response regulator
MAEGLGEQSARRARQGKILARTRAAFLFLDSGVGTMEERREVNYVIEGHPAPPLPRILIVDDEAFVRDVLAQHLTSEGYGCRAAASAEEAHDILRVEEFPLLICDIRLPGRSGIDFLSIVKREFPDMAVIMLTALDDRETAARVLKLGAYGFVTKPYDPNDLFFSVANALERRRGAIENREQERRLKDKVNEQTQNVRSSQEEIALRLIAASEYRDDETGAHIRRIGLYAESIAKELGRPAEYADTLRLAAPMHDIGKIGIPDAVLLKPGWLTSEERVVMQSHTMIGGRILEGTAIPLLNVAREIAVRHHEKWDGSGYPDGISGAEIPEAARIVAVLDVYDALVHERVYRPAFSENEALAIMRENKTIHFDPAVFDVFQFLLPVFRDIRDRVKDETVPPTPWSNYYQLQRRRMTAINRDQSRHTADPE